MNQRTSTTLPRRSSTFIGEALNHAVVSQGGAGLPTMLETSVLSASGPTATGAVPAAGADAEVVGLASASGAAGASRATLRPQPRWATAIADKTSLFSMPGGG